MKYLVVSLKYGNEPTSFDNQVRLFEGFTICAETRRKELADRLVDYYNKTHKNCRAEVQVVLEDGDITDVDIDKNLNRISQMEMDKYINKLYGLF